MKQVKVKDLSLDLRNYRTMPQKTEADAIEATITGNPEWFWALTESLLDDGYHPTENILVLALKNGDREQMVVKEGNRRIAALKLILGYAKSSGLGMPSEIAKRIGTLAREWTKSNEQVPCTVYGPSETKIVDKIVTLTHGKGEKAGRDKWNAVARARHNRDASGASEPALDLLESYLQHGRNITAHDRAKWARDFPLSVLEEAMKRLAPRLGLASSRTLADAYPKKIAHRNEMERLFHDIGMEQLRFDQIRDRSHDFVAAYGIPALKTSPDGGAGGSAAARQSATTGTASAGGTTSGTSAQTTSRSSEQTGATASTQSARRTAAVPINDPRAVTRALKSFQPMGKGREKIVALVKEARTLSVKKHPHAFCFVLRSMFELSAKAYCKDHAASGLSSTKQSGEDKHLVDVLREITNHMTANKSDKEKKKQLHGAMTELGKTEGFLSVTSMNQLVHNPRFSVDDTHICTLFGNIFPLLEEMNR